MMENNFKDCVGKTPVIIEGKSGDESFKITFSDKTCMELYHDQDCCEDVWLEDVIGDPHDLLGLPIVEALEECPDLPPTSEREESYTWTFYTFRNNKATVTLRFYGSSNGYYSESVDTRWTMAGGENDE